MLSTPTRSRSGPHLIPLLSLGLALVACSPLNSDGGEFVANQTDGEGLASAPIDLPPTVGIRSSTGKKCVGTFITGNLIITTAACVQGAQAVSVISRHSAFRSLPASQDIHFHPDTKLSGGSILSPGLDLALIMMKRPIAPASFIASLASAKAKVGSEVDLLGFVHKDDAKARKHAADSVINLSANRIDSINAKADGLLTLVSKVEDIETELDLPYEEDLGAPLYNSKQELQGIAQYTDPLTANFVNLSNPSVHSFIQKILKAHPAAHPEAL